MTGNIDFEIIGIGPIEKSKFKIKNINVFYGPNNSGKSIIAKLIHGFYLVHEVDKLENNILQSKIDEPTNINQKIRQIDIKSFKYIGEDINKIITYKRDQASVTIKTKIKGKSIRFEREIKKDSVGNKKSLITSGNIDKIQSSIYIHAARIGILHTLDSLLHMMYRTKENPTFLFDSNFSDIIELILWYRLKPKLKLNQHLNTLFSGNVELSNQIKSSIGIQYVDKSGFSTSMLEVGSGIQAAFPILLSLEKISKNGLLVIEEPEAHLEPSTLIQLVEILFAFTKENKGKLIITTHSEWLIKKFQSLISEQKLSVKDISMLKFNRKETFTKIQDITLTNDGFSEEEFYEDAQNSL